MPRLFLDVISADYWLSALSVGRRAGYCTLVDSEVLCSFIDQDSPDPNDDTVLVEILDKEIAPGLRLGDLNTPEQLGSALLAKQAERPVDEPSPTAVSPQRGRQSARSRLSDRTKSVAAHISDDLGVSRNGSERRGSRA